MKRQILRSLFLFLCFTALSLQVLEAQSLSDFNKAAKKAQRNPSKASNKKKLLQIYTPLQKSNVQVLVKGLSQLSDSPSSELTKVLTNYSELKSKVEELYPGESRVDGEEKLDLLKSQVLQEYYDKGKTLSAGGDKNDYIAAMPYLSFVKMLSPGYEDVDKLYDVAVAKSSYNILLSFDLNQFREYQRLSEEVLIDLSRRYIEFDRDQMKYHYQYDPEMEYQMVIELKFDFLELGSVGTKRNEDLHTRQIGNQTISGTLENTIYKRNMQASGNVVVTNSVTKAQLKKEPFNIRVRAEEVNTVISGDQRAIPPNLLRQAQNNQTTQIDFENNSMNEFKQRLTQVLVRHIRQDYTKG